MVFAIHEDFKISYLDASKKFCYHNSVNLSLRQDWNRISKTVTLKQIYNQIEAESFLCSKFHERARRVLIDISN